MEQIYALGVSCIELVQYWLENYAGYFEVINKISDPHNIIEVLFPFISIIDSVFATQLIFVMAFGGWLNSIIKWWLLEDRPYWWIQETTFYKTDKPYLIQTKQTCMTGPGNPSGHTTAAASVLILVVMWISHIINDRKWTIWWWKYITFPLFGFGIVSVILARMFVATHFPHQCFFGVLLGLFLSPALCIYVTDPFIWRYGPHVHTTQKTASLWHRSSAVAAMLAGVVTYYSLVLCGLDPHYTVKLAFRWCETPDSIQVSSTPMFGVVLYTANILGLALSATPDFALYRHYTKNRSLIISLFATVISVFGFKQLQENITKTSAFRYYSLHFILNAIRPSFLLRFIPALSMWPYGKEKIH